MAVDNVDQCASDTLFTVVKRVASCQAVKSSLEKEALKRSREHKRGVGRNGG